MHESIHVLIVEDDFRIAEINRQLVDQVDGFHTVNTVKTAEETLVFLEKGTNLPHLILLDIYVPDSIGLHLFWEIRKHYHEIDIIILTAAKEVTTIQETLKGGIYDYMVKPVDIDRLEQTLTNYREQVRILSSKDQFDQEEIDQLIRPSKPSIKRDAPIKNLPKGIDDITLTKVNAVLKEKGKGGVTALEASKHIGLNRSTARRYLEYLVSVEEVYAELSYGDVGRPERKYIASSK
ncbi:CitB family two-component system response regulator CitT [Virgibacillus natechei]|uniref:CitB family two-component system response regulator CitT n=1 Tax=Virgibacillus natechei TaxID=1216297 RepID=A0ABS4IJH6_9BACI|nr:response regulator [Virgibacillus natechei]MBP1971110.1 CitB family two-component system response regulator CitT [Virgibacillus natechei]UZD12204.1 response regulator [Virgibacillus natechei]